MAFELSHFASVWLNRACERVIPRPRNENSVGVTVDLKAEQIDQLGAELQPEFQADTTQIRETFAMGRAANVIHPVTAWELNLFPLRAGGGVVEPHDLRKPG